MKYYLTIQDGDLENARYVGSNLLSEIQITAPQVDRRCRPTDPKVTHSGKNEQFSGIKRKAC